METIRIVTDSSSGIGQKEADGLGIDVIPMPITINGKEYLDGIDLFYEDAVEHMRAIHTFTTAQPLPKYLLEKWEIILETYDKIIYIPLSSQLSGSFMNASMLANAYDGRIVVVDALAVELPLRFLCLEAKKMVEHGKTVEEIKMILEKESHETFALIVPETVAQLKRGGRITPAAAAVASLLKIQPILKIENGKVDLHSKVRTLKKAYQEAMHNAINVENLDTYHWLMLQVAHPDAEVYRSEFEGMLGRKVTMCNFTPIIMAHTGLRTLGFGHIKKYYEE